MRKEVIWIVVFILFSFSVFAIAGDFNEDRCVNLEDFFLFAEQFDKQVTKINEKFDLDNNKKIDVEDFFIFAEEFGECMKKN